MTIKCLAAALLAAASLNAFAAGPSPSYGERLEGFRYPWALHHYAFRSQGQALEMGYMDVAPGKTSNGQTVVLLHGKNFCAATWESTVRALSRRGYRVIAPDQIGFCTASKPERYQYSFQQLAQNTRRLLAERGVDKAIIIGHSTGGMLAARYALMYPDSVSTLVLVNPIGLEDWKAKGVPYRSVDSWYRRELKISADTTAIGSDIASAQLKATLGHYGVLGKQAAARIPHARLIEFPGMGHAPQMEDPARFNAALAGALAGE